MLAGGVLAGACLVAAEATPVPGAPAPANADAAAAQADAVLTLPNAKDSLKFAVLGDFGTGDKRQYALARQMAEVHARFPFEMVVLVGDNIYGSDRPQDYKKKFEDPYKPLLDAGVKFYGALGNHDAREQRFYKLFNMEGKHYYDFKAPKENVRFFALESTYMEPEQQAWLEKALSSSREDWKIVFQHHPLYSSGKTHGSDERLRAAMEPLLIKYGVSLVLTGHDHLYERSKPQHGITHFVAGSGGKLRPGDFRPNQPFSARLVDTTNVFVVMEVKGDSLTFNSIATDGSVVDSGELSRIKPAPAPTPAAGDGAR
ncbi:MAG TPA: metallophosphoesterase [Luteitalea sp.]|nr:metallophosphoesterase [Luteitalea sp.]